MSTTPATLFEDDDLIILNKPSGLLTEGGGDRERDLEQLARNATGKAVHCCHRLDRLTSGAVLLRKTARYNRELAALFEQHRLRKLYWAIVDGAWPRGINKVETHIAPVGGGRFANVTSGGKLAVTTVRVLGRYDQPTALTWLGLLLKTGRTHQARLHCAHLGCPVTGDPLYGPATADGTFGLHARELRFKHPATGAEVVATAPVPAAWAAWSDDFVEPGPTAEITLPR
ncbi:RluA family pseudouridine synthase [Synoicihabitans lomoniglobus]|uniref:RluA family pseudouridine synthase n=1 Tax=Synoicihabitans lomoniglobus TaxID=2909285 RepID=A0AAE9ZTD9_9BACT|nr:RluA family pseudouridine synthase [Opitutaceae bacterium LMO-M01]WED63762.1 RluA family pseudouridine synthase [Opitutaceae bacterium LMO-M01]